MQTYSYVFIFLLFQRCFVDGPYIVLFSQLCCVVQDLCSFFFFCSDGCISLPCELNGRRVVMATALCVCVCRSHVMSSQNVV